ncbi:MAG: SIMPL domain-containing protein [Luteitalea sp.]
MRTTILIAVLAAASSLPALAQPPPPGGPPRDVVVSSGQGLVKRAPDQVFVTVAAEARSRQPREAQQQNATVMTAVRARLAAFALAEDAIRTLSVDMQPEFDWANGKQTLRGYLASNVIDVRLDDVARVGEVVDAVVAAGASRVSGVRFTLKDMAGAEREALRLASADALARAGALAAGAGRGVDRVVHLDETGRGPQPPPQPTFRTMQAADAQATPTPVTAGEVEVRVSVTLTALLK